MLETKLANAGFFFVLILAGLRLRVRRIAVGLAMSPSQNRRVRVQHGVHSTNIVALNGRLPLVEQITGFLNEPKSCGVPARHPG